MSRVDTVAGDRLPWLPDEPLQKPARKREGTLLPWAAAALLLVAGGGFWLGMRSADKQVPVPAHQAPVSTTVPLPAPRSTEPPQVRIPAEPEVRTPSAPEVRPAPVREVHIAPPRASKPAEHEEATAQASDRQKQVEKAPAAAATAFVPPKPWNPRIVSGAAGRLVQVGAFGSIHQAKRGWWFMVRAYPAVSHLPAVVRPTRNSKGRIFYRFQVGTTSQAHSEILCQRMQKIRLSCAVVGLPWKAKVER